jgi:hypothetical protein
MVGSKRNPVRSPAVLVGSLLAFTVWETRRPLRRRVEPRGRRFARNAAVAAISYSVVGLVDILAFASFSAWVERHGAGLLGLVVLPSWLRLVDAVLLLDWTNWVWHWLNHRVHFLWRFRADYTGPGRRSAVRVRHFDFIRAACRLGSQGAAMLLALASIARAQIVTENAGVLSPETPVLRESLSVFESENLDEVRVSNQLIYSVDTKREFKLTLPFLSRDVDFAGVGGTPEDDRIQGIGDISLRFKQSLWQVDDVMESTRWALLAEVGAPTGKDDGEEHGALLPPRLQLGTGDWSLGFGSAFTLIRDRQRASIEALFRYRTPNDDIRLGESLDLNLAYWYRLQPAAFDPDRYTTEVRGVIELLSSYRWPSEISGTTADDDGAIVWLAPGIQIYPGTDVLLEANVQIPLYQDLDDAVGHREWAAAFVLKFLF